MIVTQWITLILPGVEHSGLGRQLATSTSSEDRAAEIERSVLASLAPKATATVKKRLFHLNQYGSYLSGAPLHPIAERDVFAFLAFVGHIVGHIFGADGALEATRSAR
eukprot:5458235-Amphidinium_carterae.1